MKHVVALLIALSITSPAQAEGQTMDNLLKQFEDLSKNAQSMLEGWVADIGPKLEELGPTLEEFADKIGDMSAYHPPEILDNGDIIIRRKIPTEPIPAPEAEKEAAPNKEPIDL